MDEKNKTQRTIRINRTTKEGRDESTEPKKNADSGHKDHHSSSLNKQLLNLLDVPYSGRPAVTTSYVPPTLFHSAHEVLSIDHGGKTHTLFLGPKTTASERALDALLEANIVAIVNCTIHSPCYHRSHFRYCQVPVQDVRSADILTYLEGTTTFINNMMKEGSVLVHCEQGMSRSATVVMAYLMTLQHMTREQSYLLCKAKRPMTNPNEGFWRQLEEYEKQLHASKPTIPTAKESQHSTDEKNVKLWARRSLALYMTCRDIHDVFETHDSWKILENFRSDKDTMTTFLAICLDFVWGRGVSDDDIEWLLLVCKQFSDSSEGCNMKPQSLLQGLLSDECSVFLDAWSGEVDPRDRQRLFDALHKSMSTQEAA